MSGPAVTVIGSFAVGMTMRAPKLPVFGETMFGNDFNMGPGGKGSNQAVGAARLGAKASLGAILGDDKLADIATDLYSAEGIDASLVETSGEHPTGAGFITLNAAGENFILLDMGANDLMDPAFVDRAEPRIQASDVVLSVLEIPVPAATRAMEIGRHHGVTTILNPAPATALPDSMFEHIDFLTPNESELRLLLGLPADDARDSRELAAELRRRGARNVIVTLGRSGVLVLTDEIDTHLPAIDVDVVDTTGAGDAFNAGLAVALGEGRPVVEAVRIATVCGALACRELGVIPGLPQRADIDACLSNVNGP